MSACVLAVLLEPHAPGTARAIVAGARGQLLPSPGGAPAAALIRPLDAARPLGIAA